MTTADAVTLRAKKVFQRIEDLNDEQRSQLLSRLHGAITPETFKDSTLKIVDDGIVSYMELIGDFDYD